MGYAVLHIQKGQGDDGKMSSHIERKNHPENADATRTHLNRELIDFPEGVENRTQAIQHRIDNANIARKIGKNQVRAIRIMLSGSPEDMKRIQESGKLDNWCKDSLDWVRNTFGKDNLVSAVLHKDEETPHIHATVVPIVTGERRKLKDKKQEDDPSKKKYRRKDRSANRLCVDDVISQTKLTEFQDTYAEKMKSYGLERGVRGSDARHITTAQYYRDLFERKEDLQTYVDGLLVDKMIAEEKIYDLYNQRDQIRDKFLAMENHLEQKSKELTHIETRIERVKQDYEPYKAQDKLNQIHELLPMVKEQLRIADLAQKIGLGIEHIKTMFEGKYLTGKAFSFFSPEHNQKFDAKDFKLEVQKEVDNPKKLRLSLNGVDILDWFRERYEVLKEKVSPRIQPNMNKGRGFRR